MCREAHLAGSNPAYATVMNSRTMQEETAKFKSHLRDLMAEMLNRCTEPQKDLFKRMYNSKGKYSRDVDSVRDDQMDHAFYQIENTKMEVGNV